MSLSTEFNMIGARADNALSRYQSYLVSRLEVFNGEMVLVEQPDFGPPYLGTYGASCATIALIAAGTSQDDPLIRRLLEYLCDHQMGLGGWTIRNAQHVGLTTACAFSLIAFGLSGFRTEREKTAVSNGVEWLTRNAKREGWPFFEGGSETGTTPTALAVRALNQVKHSLTPGHLKTLQHGCAILEKAISDEGFVLGRDGEPSMPSVPVTALTLITLRECGYPGYAEPLKSGVEWLKQQTDWSHDNSDSFYAHAPGEAAGQMSGHVNYVHFTPAIVIQALLSCEVDIIREPIVSQLVDHLLTAQTRTGDWRSPLAPRETPTWMGMDAALALNRFIKVFAGVRPTLMFRDEVSRLDGQLSFVVNQTSQSCDSLGERLSTLEKTVLFHQKKLDLLSPTIGFVRTSLPFLPFTLIFVVYVYLRLTLENPHWILDIAGNLMSFLSLILGVKAIVDSRRDSRVIDQPQLPLLLNDQSDQPLGMLADRQPDRKGS